MRGKAVLVLFENRHARITPAYAGKSDDDEKEEISM